MSTSNSSSSGGRMPRWRSAKPAPPRDVQAKSQRQTKVILLLATLLVVVAALLALWFYRRPFESPKAWSIPIREYKAQQWPINAFAVQDGESLLKHFATQQEGYTGQALNPLRNQLSALRESKEGPIVLHICAHAAMNGDQICLLPGDATPDSPDYWLPLEEVLKALHDCPVRQKLLILDVARPFAGARIGIIKNDIAQQIQDYLQSKEADLPCLVLLSCSGGQTSLVSEDAGLSAFAFYLDLGLQGMADGADANGRKDGRITVHELAAYTGEAVNAWASHNRGQPQRPRLFGKASDFELVSIDAAASPSPVELSELPKYPKWLADGWKLRDEWRSNGSYRAAPFAFRQLEALLLRNEQRWQGGFVESDVETDFARSLEIIQKNYQMAVKFPTPPVVSLTAADHSAPAKELKVDPDLEVRDLLQKINPELKPKDEELEKYRKAFLEKVKDVPKITVLAATVRTLSQVNEPMKQQIKLVNDLIADLKPSQYYVETIFLHRLKELIAKMEERSWEEWPAPTVQQLLKSIIRAENLQIALANSPYTLPWVAEDFQQAEKNRREAEKILFDERPESWSRAYELLRTANRTYAQIQIQIEQLESGFSDLSDAYILLPAYESWLIAVAKVQPREDEAWLNATKQAVKLFEALAKSQPGNIDAVVDARLPLRLSLNRLSDYFRKRRTEAADRADDAGSYLELKALLSCPVLNGPDRIAVWEQMRHLGRRLHEETVSAQQAGTNVPSSASSDALDKTELQRARRRAQYSLSLLQMAGLKDTEKLSGAVDLVVRGNANADWQGLGQQFRIAWGKQLLKQYLSSRKDLLAAERMSYFLPPFDLDRDSIPDRDAWAQNPTLQLRREQIRNVSNLISQCYDAQSQLYPESSPYRRFYSDAASAYTR